MSQSLPPFGAGVGGNMKIEITWKSRDEAIPPEPDSEAWRRDVATSEDGIDNLEFFKASMSATKTAKEHGGWPVWCDVGGDLFMGIARNKIELTTDHPTSSYNIPVFVEAGKVIDYPDGIKAIRREKGWSTRDLGQLVGVSPRTVEGWEAGRMPSVIALRMLQKILSE
jgi:DNA-binding XRE family transcriptional regulator